VTADLAAVNSVCPQVLINDEPVWTAEYVTWVGGLRLGATFDPMSNFEWI